MLSWLWDFIKNPDNRAVVAFLGGGAVVVAGGIWKAITFFADRKKDGEKKGGDTNVTVGQGFGSGGNTSIGGNVNVGPSNEHIEQIQKPLAEQVAAQNALIAAKDAKIDELYNILLEAKILAKQMELLNAAIVLLTKGIPAVFKFLKILFFGTKESNEKKGFDTSIGVQNIGPSPEHIEQIQKPTVEQRGQKDAHIAALTKMLLEKNPAAAPGAQQAVGGAVQSIAQGAAEGDTRLQQALELLKAYKTTEAEPLLKAFAEDKTARIEKDREEAAIAYRNLGAIAGLRDPKGAREAYAKVVALDPENADGLAWDGWFQLDAHNLDFAEKSYRALLQLAGKGASEHQIFRARTGLGDIVVARGDLNAALVAYGEARSAMERLAASDAGNAEWQRDLSVSYEKIGDVQVAQGDLTRALISYRNSLAIADRLAKADSGHTGWQRDLLVSYIKLGDVQVAQGNLAGALTSYRDSLAIADRLAKADSGHTGWQRDLLVSYEKIGNVQVAQGDLAGALTSYRDSLAIADRLAKADPGNAEWQRDLAMSFGKLALVHKQSGDNAKARDFLRQGQAIIARLTKLSPDNAVWAKDLAWFDAQIAALD